MVASSKSAELALVKVEGAGTKVGASLIDVGTASDRAAPRVQNLRTALSSFDGVLASMGVNIGTEIRGLNDLSDASGKTFTQLGLISTAGLAASAALGGWKLGRLISEFFELDKAIGNATAKLMGWGDLSGETAGAQQDVVTRAIERGAAATITYSDALAFNNEWLKKRQGALAADEVAQKANTDAQNKLNLEAERWGLIMAELNTAGGNWFETLKGIDGEVVEAIKFYLAAGVAQGTLATAYGVTAVQVKAVATAMSEELAMAKVLNDFISTASANQAALDARAMASIEAKTKALRDAEAAALAFNEAFLQAALADALAQDAKNFGGPIDTSGMHSGQRGPGINQGGSLPFGGAGSGGGVGIPVLHPLRGFGGPGIAGQSYLVGDRGPELYTPGASGFFTPGGGASVNVVIHVNGTAEDVARKISDTLTRTLMQAAKLGAT